MAHVIRITTYHDILCCWCYLAAGRLRKAIEGVQGRVILGYRLFPLHPTGESYLRRFGSGEQAKEVIMEHWAAAKAHPDGGAINVTLMRQRHFPYPPSMPVMKGVKAAEQQGGVAGHEAYATRAREVHFLECRNLADTEVLIKIARDVGLDLPRFVRDLEDPQREAEVYREHEAAVRRGIRSTPTVVFDDRWALPGTVPLAHYRRVLEMLSEDKEPQAPLIIPGVRETSTPR